MTDEISLCDACNCMTHTVEDSKCGKCGESKLTYFCKHEECYPRLCNKIRKDK